MTLVATQTGLHFRKNGYDKNGKPVERLDFADVGKAPDQGAKKKRRRQENQVMNK
jgi:hypothetical protein